MTTGAGGSSGAGALVTAPLRNGALLSVWTDRLESAGISYPLADIVWAALVNDPAAPQGMPPAPAVAWRMADGRYVSAAPANPPQAWQILETLYAQRPDLRTPLPPPPPPPGYAPYPPQGYAAYAQPQRNDNQTVMAGLAHLSILFGALVVPLVLWLVNRGKAPYAAQQSKQAFFFHVAVAVVEFIVIGVFLAIFFASMSAMVASTTYVDQTASGFFVGGIFLFYGVIFAIQIAAIVFGVIGAVKAFKGEPFHYPLMGGL